MTGVRTRRGPRLPVLLDRCDKGRDNPPKVCGTREPRKVRLIEDDFHRLMIEGTES